MGRITGPMVVVGGGVVVWVPVVGSSPEKANARTPMPTAPKRPRTRTPATMNLSAPPPELAGTGISGNPEGSSALRLMPHKGQIYRNCPRDAHLVPAWLAQFPIEGIVWHHEDGRMVKIKAKDFGIKWPR